MPDSPAVREAVPGDLPGILALYAFLHDEPAGPNAPAIFAEMLADPNQFLLLNEAGGGPVASCTLTVVRNLTRGARPYGVIENVITHPAHRRQGLGRAVMEEAARIAAQRGCYKLMLLTGIGRGAAGFYESLGYSPRAKIGMVRYLSSKR